MCLRGVSILVWICFIILVGDGVKFEWFISLGKGRLFLFLLLLVEINEGIGSKSGKSFIK